jgi:hypothetical protein
MMMTAVLLVVALTASAQKLSKQQQEDAMLNLFARATLVNNKFAITREPITYYDYWAATGEKAHGPNTSVTNAAIVSDGRKQKMVNCINEYFGERVVSLATNAQIDEAHKKIGLHRELSENSIAGSGFFLSMTAAQYKKFKSQYDNHNRSMTSSTKSKKAKQKKTTKNQQSSTKNQQSSTKKQQNKKLTFDF